MPTSKDYYDILGVRPTAKQSEIELAFKGRRTQYHPDKYAGTDPETIRWATEKMQEVNEAYQVLSDIDRRRSYDARRNDWRNDNSARASSDSSHRDFQQSNANQTGRKSEPFILDYLNNLPLNYSDAERAHAYPNIPQKKLTKALDCRSFSSESPTNAYLLVDDTAFQGGTEGLLITDQYISFKSLFGDSIDYNYKGGWNGGFDVKGNSVFRHGELCKTFVHVSMSALLVLVQALKRFFSDRLQWRKTLALQGDVQAQFLLSGSFPRDPEEELRWLTMAAENGHMVAQHNLGIHFMSLDPQRAFQWLTKAAHQGSESAQRRLNSNEFKSFR